MPSTSPPHGSVSFGWLWLSDLHYGQPGHLWDKVKKEEFFRDLSNLHQLSGPWDVIVVTGDLVFSGSADEFKGLASEFKQIFDELQEQQEEKPYFLSIPGNHDLTRPDQAASAMTAFQRWWEDETVREAFWREPDSEYRRLVVEAFRAYTEWCVSNGLPSPPLTKGLLPGDFSTRITKGGKSLGFVGLNSTFLQLSGGNYLGKLDLDPRQLNEVCNGRPVSWIEGNHASILLTHHPVDWLHDTAKDRYRAYINPTTSFVAHLYGHMHEPETTALSRGMAPERRNYQGCSLFGLEKFGDPPKERLKLGYAAFRLVIDDHRGHLYFWPRELRQRQSGGWGFNADTTFDLFPNELYALTEITPKKSNVPLPSLFNDPTQG